MERERERIRVREGGGEIEKDREKEGERERGEEGREVNGCPIDVDLAGRISDRGAVTTVASVLFHRRFCRFLI